jgi:hypothetical protein
VFRVVTRPILLIVAAAVVLGACGSATTATTAAGDPPAHAHATAHPGRHHRGRHHPATRAPAGPSVSPSQFVPSDRGDCFEAPAACGYPAPSNSGVPRSASLTAFGGDMVIRSRGDVVSDVAVRGTVEIVADNVTIKDSSVMSAGSSGHAVWIAPGVTGVRLLNDTLAGRSAVQAPVQYSVQNSGSDAVFANHLRMYNCTTCWAGPGTVENSYAIADAIVAGAHYEPVYYGGGGGALVLQHDTLLNPHQQTADVFASVDFGDLTTVTIADSFLAGGGYTIYGGLTGNRDEVVGPFTVTEDRFARCATRRIPNNSDGGYHCLDGADAHGYWPFGGQYGVAADFNSSVTTWTHNYWDGSGRPIRYPG